MSSTDFEIAPFVGVGRLLLGMSSAGIEGVLGAPREVSKSEEGRSLDYFPGPYCTLEGEGHAERLVEIGFDRHFLELSYRGVRLFRASRRAVLRHLASDDDRPVEGFGVIVFPRLGISLSGFAGGVTEDLAATVFERGRWDDEIGRMKPFSV